MPNPVSNGFGNHEDNFNHIPQSIFEVQVCFPSLQEYYDLSWFIQIFIPNQDIRYFSLLLWQRQKPLLTDFDIYHRLASCVGRWSLEYLRNKNTAKFTCKNTYMWSSE